MTAPTQRQAQVLAYLRNYTAEHGYAPTIREIASHMGVKSTNSVRGFLDALARKGLVVLGEPYKSRTLRVVDSNGEVLARYSDRELRSELKRRKAARGAAEAAGART